MFSFVCEFFLSCLRRLLKKKSVWLSSSSNLELLTWTLNLPLSIFGEIPTLKFSAVQSTEESFKNVMPDCFSFPDKRLNGLVETQQELGAATGQKQNADSEQLGNAVSLHRAALSRS